MIFMGSHCAGDHCWSNNLLLVTKPTMYILPLEAHGQWTPDICENLCCHTRQAPTFLNCREPEDDREQIMMPLAIIMDNINQQKSLRKSLHEYQVFSAEWLSTLGKMISFAWIENEMSMPQAKIM